MPDLGIGEAIAAITALGSEAAAGVGTAAAGLGEAAAGAGAGLFGAAEAGLGGLFGEAGAGLGELAGVGTTDAGAAGIGGTEAALAGAGAPAAAAGGIAPAGAGAIDLASAAAPSLGSDVSAFSGVGGGIANQTADIFAGIPTQGFSGGLGGGAEGFSAGEVGGFNPTTLSFGNAGVPGVATTADAGFGGTTDLAALTGGGGNPAAGVPDLASLTGGGGGGAVGPGSAAANPAAGGAGGGFFDNLGTGAVNSITKNPLGVGLGAAGLGYNIINSNKMTDNLAAVSGNAATEAAQGQQLQSYLQTGTLPAGLQASIDNATKAAKAKIISGYAARGQPADPARNSALAQELNQVDLNAVAAAGQLQTQLLTTGINEVGLSNQLYQFLVGHDDKQAQLTGQAIANFAAAMSGGGKGPTIQIGGTSA